MNSEQAGKEWVKTEAGFKYRVNAHKSSKLIISSKHKYSP